MNRNRGRLDATETARDHPDVAASLNARIAVVALIILCQLWALTVALDAWLGGDTDAVWWLLGFQVLAFVSALLISRASPRS
jgi:hypothetical protein